MRGDCEPRTESAIGSRVVRRRGLSSGEKRLWELSPCGRQLELGTVCLQKGSKVALCNIAIRRLELVLVLVLAVLSCNKYPDATQRRNREDAAPYCVLAMKRKNRRSIILWFWLWRWKWKWKWRVSGISSYFHLFP